MFKVPTDPNNPSYKQATKVTFWQWLTSSKQQRQDWRTRRDAVGRARVARAHARVEQAEAATRQAKANHRAAKQQAKTRIKDKLRLKRH